MNLQAIFQYLEIIGFKLTQTSFQMLYSGLKRKVQFDHDTLVSVFKPELYPKLHEKLEFITKSKPDYTLLQQFYQSQRRFFPDSFVQGENIELTDLLLSKNTQTTEIEFNENYITIQAHTELKKKRLAKFQNLCKIFSQKPLSNLEFKQLLLKLNGVNHDIDLTSSVDVLLEIDSFALFLSESVYYQHEKNLQNILYQNIIIHNEYLSTFLKKSDNVINLKTTQSFADSLKWQQMHSKDAQTDPFDFVFKSPRFNK
ncbi:Hypothetical_protein [Hexamita inflata]|uniref:Hypothetical_protein n=1 Tax=Hexamita inflata TaxID=28002 RepID=A0AA86TVR6_9EUKA|nr:Hypothetical protein HINF_LOCUS18435 [Hexamita inflata]